MFNEWQLTLERMGYSNFVQVLNAKTHGYPTPVPQNRKRVFMVSILDCKEPFYFPDEQPLTTSLRDMLEDVVDEKYYLTDARIKQIAESTKWQESVIRQQNNIIADNGISPAITSLHANHAFKVAQFNKNQSGAVYDADGIAPAICAVEGVKCHTNVLLGWTRDAKGEIVDRHPVEVANAVTAAKRDNTQNYVVNPNYRIRKLTPRECFRLMGVRDEDIDKIQAAGLSKTQQYKMAGNSIVVNCLAAIFRQLFIGNFNTNQKTKTMYKQFITKDESKGFNRSKKRALELLSQRKFDVHNICVGSVRKVALCDGDELLQIISRAAYQEFITPELPLEQ